MILWLAVDPTPPSVTDVIGPALARFADVAVTALTALVTNPWVIFVFAFGVGVAAIRGVLAGLRLRALEAHEWREFYRVDRERLEATGVFDDERALEYVESHPECELSFSPEGAPIVVDGWATDRPYVPTEAYSSRSAYDAAVELWKRDAK